MAVIDVLKEHREFAFNHRRKRLAEIEEHQRMVAVYEAEIADLDKAISALTPEDGNDALLADQQDTPPQSSPQASETDAADDSKDVVGVLLVGGSAYQLHRDGSAGEELADAEEVVDLPREAAFRLNENGVLEQYDVADEPAEASEPKEEISVLTGDPAIEPESGLHGEPLPPSGLDSQAEPQTKSEQSEIHHPDAQYWTKALEQDRKPQPGFIEGAISKLFGVKEPA